MKNKPQKRNLATGSPVASCLYMGKYFKGKLQDINLLVFKIIILKLRTQIKPMNLENSIIDRLIICFRHIKQAFLLEHLAKPLKNLLKSCQFVH